MGYVELVVRREGRFLRWCARKRLHEQHRSDPTFRSMFLDEARLAGLIHHPNAVGVQDVGADDEGPFFIMDFVEGVSLSRMIGEATTAGRSIPMQVALRVCLGAACGLHAAHEVRAEDGTVLRLVHRDVSPQNILIGFDGTVRVTDFGIAKALGNSTRTSAGVLKGNMGYLAPEQLRFEEPDRRSDLFSLGVTLYEMLSGQRLYPNTTGFDGTRRILTEPAPDIGEVRNDVPAELCELLFELLAKDRDSRPATAAEIASRLEGVLALLIREEGSVTVADYMDQHFGAARQQQRAELASHLTRIEAKAIQARPVLANMDAPDGPAALASATSVASEDGGRARSRSRSGRRLAVVAAATAAVAIAIAIVWPSLHRRGAELSPPRAMSTPSASGAVAAKAPSLAANPAPQSVAILGDTQAVPGTAAARAGMSAPGRRALSAPGARSPHRLAYRAARRARNLDSKKIPADTSKAHGDSTALSVPLFERWQ
jgi:eukaryotic-like serine/threonine-protein kinase